MDHSLFQRTFLIARGIDQSSWLKLHSWLTWAVCLLSMGMFHAFFTRSYLEPIRYEFYTFLNLTPKSMALLSGLWLSTTRFGSRYRVLTSILLLPSFGFVDFAYGDFGGLAALIFFGTIIWSYWIVITRTRISK